MDTLEMRIKRGEIPMYRFNDTVQRVWNLKERFGLLKKERVLIREFTSEDRIEGDKTAKEI